MELTKLQKKARPAWPRAENKEGDGTMRLQRQEGGDSAPVRIRS